MSDLGWRVKYLDLWNLFIAIVSLGLTYQVRIMTFSSTVLKESTVQHISSLKTYAAISNAHLFRVCKRGKMSGSCLSTLNGFGSTQLPKFLCHIGVPTFCSQNN